MSTDGSEREVSAKARPRSRAAGGRPTPVMTTHADHIAGVIEERETTTLTTVLAGATTTEKAETVITSHFLHDV